MAKIMMIKVVICHERDGENVKKGYGLRDYYRSLFLCLFFSLTLFLAMRSRFSRRLSIMFCCAIKIHSFCQTENDIQCLGDLTVMRAREFLRLVWCKHGSAFFVMSDVISWYCRHASTFFMTPVHAVQPWPDRRQN